MGDESVELGEVRSGNALSARGDEMGAENREIVVVAEQFAESVELLNERAEFARVGTTDETDVIP